MMTVLLVKISMESYIAVMMMTTWVMVLVLVLLVLGGEGSGGCLLGVLHV